MAFGNRNVYFSKQLQFRQHCPAYNSKVKFGSLPKKQRLYKNLTHLVISELMRVRALPCKHVFVDYTYYVIPTPYMRDVSCTFIQSPKTWRKLLMDKRLLITKI